MNNSYVLAIHGGAGTISPTGNGDMEQIYHQALREAIAAGEAILAQNGRAIDAVTAAVVALENCPLFNAGHGSVYTADGLHEMDASLMDGGTLAAGAVAGVSTVGNPILLARAVMEKTDCVLLSGAGAERFARECGIEALPPAYFATPHRLQQLLSARQSCVAPQLDHDGASAIANQSGDPIDPNQKFGTVGAVARDQYGNLAAATSTGGMTNKRPGRIGDSPLIGAGCYADNGSVAVSATGTGEHFIRTVLAYDIAARIKYGKLPLNQAASQAVMEKLAAIGGRGGVIAIDHDGNLAMPFNTSGMYRAWVRQNQKPVTAIFADPIEGTLPGR